MRQKYLSLLRLFIVLGVLGFINACSGEPSTDLVTDACFIPSPTGEFPGDQQSNQDICNTPPPPVSSPSIPFNDLPQKQKDFIAAINKIIDDMSTPFSPSEISQNFRIVWGTKTRPQNLNLWFFGESHIGSKVLLANYRYINLLIKSSDDVVLFEGYPADSKVGCLYLTVFRIYVAQQWEKQFPGRAYKALEYALFRDTFNPYWILLRGYTNGRKMTLNKAICRGWDKTNDTKGLDTGSQAQWDRNTSMVETIQKYNNDNRNVFVIAGALHLPSFDYREYRFLWNSHRDYLKNIFPIESENISTFFYYYRTYYDDKESFLKKLEFAQTATSFKSIYEPANAFKQAKTILEARGFGSTYPIFSYIHDKYYSEVFPTEIWDSRTAVE